jgi:hypothetical protein
MRNLLGSDSNIQFVKDAVWGIGVHSNTRSLSLFGIQQKSSKIVHQDRPRSTPQFPLVR